MIRRFKHYFSNAIIIWLAIIFYRNNKYYINYLSNNTQNTLFYLAMAYTVAGFLYYLFVSEKRINESKGTILLSSLKRTVRDFTIYLRNFSSDIRHAPPRLSQEEKNNILFLLVKLFFLPLMIQFFFGNLNALMTQIPRLNDLSVVFSVQGFNLLIFPAVISLFFLVDTLYFVFGYSIEADFLKNKVRSVEPTAFGWIVALLAYPPFNNLSGGYINWYAHDMIKFGGDVTTMIFRIVILLLFFIYVSATIALGAKCSNLTNRGIVSRGPYAFVRHPAYTAKNLAWWVMVFPVMSIPAFFSMMTWSIIYFFRAITEERHLIKDPEYQEYVKRVKYRFIPKVF